MNIAQAGAVFREEINMVITMETPTERCLAFLDLTSVSGPVHASWKCEPRAKKEAPPFSSGPLNVVKTRHRQKQPERSLGSHFLAYDIT